jgi:hypothetical protein
MKPSDDTTIREHLARYVRGALSLRELAAWIAPISLEADKLSATARDLVYEVQLRLAEYSNGDWTEGHLRRWFKDLAHTHVLAQFDAAYTFTNQTTAATISATGSASFVGTVREVAHA